VLGTEGIAYTDDLDVALDGAEAVVIVTSWPHYRDLPERLDGRGPLVVDGRRLLPPGSVQHYDGIGFPA
jgi:UDPglucose 6-dehydrogenase